MSSDERLEVIEAMIWRTGTRDKLLVRRIMAAIRGYGHYPQRAWPPRRTDVATDARRRTR